MNTTQRLNNPVRRCVTAGFVALLAVLCGCEGGYSKRVYNHSFAETRSAVARKYGVPPSEERDGFALFGNTDPIKANPQPATNSFLAIFADKYDTVVEVSAKEPSRTQIKVKSRKHANHLVFEWRDREKPKELEFLDRIQTELDQSKK